MKVLYIRTSNIYDDSRATKEIMALAQAGHQVHVLGWDRDGQAATKTREVFANYPQQVSMDFFVCLLKGGIGARHIDKLMKWIHWTNRQIKTDYWDVVHTCNLDSALGVWKYAKKKGMKIVYDIYDYYVDSHHIPRLLQSLVENLEINIINQADATIICTQERKEQIAKARPKCLEVIHNSPEVLSPPHAKTIYDYAYCGSLFGQRLIKEIFEHYPQHSQLKVAIAGYGEFADQGESLSRAYENFTYFGPVSYDQVLLIESQSKVISAIYEPTIRNHRLCAPNKFYEALALSKPVIVCKHTGIDEIVKKHQIGCVIDYDPKQFFEAVHYLVTHPKECEQMGKRARSLYEQEYQWEIMKKRLLDLYERI